MVIIQNSIFFCLPLCRLAFSWRHRPQITLYSRTLFSRITSVMCFFLNMYILLPTIDYVHSRNESSCGMIQTLENFWYCGCWLWRWSGFFCWHCGFCKLAHRILLLVKCCSCAIRLVTQPKTKAGTSQVVSLIELLGFPEGAEEEKKKKNPED